MFFYCITISNSVDFDQTAHIQEQSDLCLHPFLRPINPFGIFFAVCDLIRVYTICKHLRLMHPLLIHDVHILGNAICREVYFLFLKKKKKKIWASKFFYWTSDFLFLLSCGQVEIFLICQPLPYGLKGRLGSACVSAASICLHIHIFMNKVNYEF